jgi:hypothetical protein
MTAHELAHAVNIAALGTVMASAEE